MFIYIIIVFDSSIEIIWTYLNVGKNSDVIVGCFYCPPHSTDTVFEDLQSSLVSIKQKYPHARIILGGDFNCPGIDWEHGTLLNHIFHVISVKNLLH